MAECFDEFDAPSPMPTRYCSRISLAEYEENTSKNTEDGLKQLLDYLQYNPTVYYEILAKRKRDETDSAGFLSYLRNRITEWYSGKTGAVDPEEARRQLAGLKSDIVKSFNYSQEAKGSTRRFSARIAEKRWRKVKGLPASSSSTTMPAFPRKDMASECRIPANSSLPPPSKTAGSLISDKVTCSKPCNKDDKKKTLLSSGNSYHHQNEAKSYQREAAYSQQKHRPDRFHNKPSPLATLSSNQKNSSSLFPIPPASSLSSAGPLMVPPPPPPPPPPPSFTSKGFTVKASSKVDQASSSSSDKQQHQKNPQQDTLVSSNRILSQKRKLKSVSRVQKSAQPTTSNDEDTSAGGFTKLMNAIKNPSNRTALKQISENKGSEGNWVTPPRKKYSSQTDPSNMFNMELLRRFQNAKSPLVDSPSAHDVTFTP